MQRRGHVFEKKKIHVSRNLFSAEFLDLRLCEKASVHRCPASFGSHHKFLRKTQIHLSQKWCEIDGFGGIFILEGICRVYPVMENPEKSWNSIFFVQAWKSHGN